MRKTLARKKKKTRKKKQPKKWFSVGAKSVRKKKAKTKTSSRHLPFRVIFIILGILCLLAAIAFGLVLLDRYVEKKSPIAAEFGPLELLDKPDWFGGQLVRKVQTAAGGVSFALDETTARTVTQNLKSLSWLYEVKAQTTNNSVQVSAKYRRPVALIRQSKAMYYIDRDLVVLDYLPIDTLEIVRIDGFSVRPPQVGQKWSADDVDAAVKLLAAIERMDEISTPEAPLLNEIASIDVSNFGGRKSSSKPHIILYAKDQTQVFWGAAYGESARYLEASEKEKIAMLYEFYKQHGTIRGIVKYIELRHPQKAIPRPK
jgi:hypothetical protein